MQRTPAAPTSSATPKEPETVAELLGVAIAEAVALEDFDPAGEQLSPRRSVSPARGPYLSREEVDRRLKPLRSDVVAGVPDDKIARRAGVSREQVRHWRRRQHLPGRRGPLVGTGTRFDIGTLLGETPVAAVHVLASPVRGAWRPPEYALRTALDYDLFAAMVHALAAQFDTDEISRGLGIAERDVRDGILLHEKRGR